MEGCAHRCIHRRREEDDRSSVWRDNTFPASWRPGFIRIWCGAHQLDIVLQDAYTHFGNETFYINLTAAIGYLRRQQNLVKDMRSQAPKVADTRWESMSSVSAWFKAHKIALNDYFELKKPSCTPLPCWWVQIMIINHFAARTTITFK